MGPSNSSTAHLAGRIEPPSESRGAILERVGSEWLAAVRAALRPLDLTHAQARLLVGVAWLGQFPGGVRQSEIAAEAGTDPVMTSEVLRLLEARGLITRAPHPTDRRAKTIMVSDDGRLLADRAFKVIALAEARFFEEGTANFGALAKALKKGGRGPGNRKH